jgi:hypothetical protein
MWGVSMIQLELAVCHPTQGGGKVPIRLPTLSTYGSNTTATICPSVCFRRATTILLTCAGAGAARGPSSRAQGALALVGQRPGAAIGAQAQVQLAATECEATDAGVSRRVAVPASSMPCSSRQHTQAPHMWGRHQLWWVARQGSCWG